VLVIVFNRGQALPLVFTRILCPRIVRETCVTLPRKSALAWPQTWLALMSVTNSQRPCPRSMRVREHSISLAEQRHDSRLRTHPVQAWHTTTAIHWPAKEMTKICPHAVRIRQQCCATVSTTTDRNLTFNSVAVSEWQSVESPVGFQSLAPHVRI